MIDETKMLTPKLLEEILREARELAAIFSASLRTPKATDKITNLRNYQLTN
jgi:hypothetical protein